MPRFVTILRRSGGGRHTVAPGRSHQLGNARTQVEWMVSQSPQPFKPPGPAQSEKDLRSFIQCFKIEQRLECVCDCRVSQGDRSSWLTGPGTCPPAVLHLNPTGAVLFRFMGEKPSVRGSKVLEIISEALL